jgi:hypothetical protein
MARQQEAPAALVRRLGSTSPAEQLEAAQGLARLAAAPDGTQRIRRAGGVPALVRLLQPGGGSEALQTAAGMTLACMLAQQEQGVAKEMSTAGAVRALVQRLPSARSPGLTQVLLPLLELTAACGEQQPIDELAASPSCLEHLAQLATDPSQDPGVQIMALGVLAGPVLATRPAAVAAAVAPHAAALVQRLSPRAGSPDAWWEEQLSAAKLVQVLANESAELAAIILAAGAVPRLVGLLSASVQKLQRAAVAAVERLAARQPSAARQVAAIGGAAEVLVKLLASCPPPASCQQAWDTVKAAASGCATRLLEKVIMVDAALAGRAVAAGALPQLTRVLRWGAPRLEWLSRQRQWEEEAEEICTDACSGLLHLLLHSGPGPVTPANQAGLPQLVQQVLQHNRNLYGLRVASWLLALLRDPGIQYSSAMQQGAAEVLRQVQPGGHPDRAAAIAALLAELTGEAQQQQAVGNSAATAAARPGSSQAALSGAQAGPVVPAECAACHALPPAGRKFQVCAGCRAVRYCSPACQKAGWRSGHKAACRAAQGGAQGGA